MMVREGFPVPPYSSLRGLTTICLAHLRPNGGDLRNPLPATEGEFEGNPARPASTQPETDFSNSPNNTPSSDLILHVT